jgi:hypothetical protein
MTTIKTERQIKFSTDVASVFFQEDIDSFATYVEFTDGSKNLGCFINQNSKKFKRNLQGLLEECRMEENRQVDRIALYNGSNDLVVFHYTKEIEKISDVLVDEYKCAYCEDLSIDRKYIRMTCGHRAHYNCWSNYCNQIRVNRILTRCLPCQIQSWHLKPPRGIISQYYFRKEMDDLFNPDSPYPPIGNSNFIRKRPFERGMGTLAIESCRFSPMPFAQSKDLKKS